MIKNTKARALIATLAIIMALFAGGSTAFGSDVTVANGTCQPYTLNGVEGQLCPNPDGNDLFYPTTGSDANCIPIPEDYAETALLCDLPDGSKGMVPRHFDDGNGGIDDPKPDDSQSYTDGSTDYGDDVIVGPSFPPQPDYEQSCEPQRREGCTWDVGVRQLLWNEALQRDVNMVGIVKGVKIEWNGHFARALPASNGEARCSIVVIPGTSDGTWLDGNWLENLTVWDANVTTYWVHAGDPEGWMKTLAVQAAEEQNRDYDCPLRNWPQDFDIWQSGIYSPPDGVSGFNDDVDRSYSNQRDSAGSDEGNGDNTRAQVDNQNRSRVTNNNRSANNPKPKCAADTVDCKPRKATVDYGGRLHFSQGAAVMGSVIKIGNKTYHTCYFRSAPGEGILIDGALHYWEKERKDQHLRACR